MSGTDGVPTDDSYAKAGGITGNDPIPVDSDSAAVESGLGSRAQQDSDEQLRTSCSTPAPFHAPHGR